MIILSIDLRKIDQSKCKSHSNGAKYCELVVMESKPNQYGNDYMVVQGLPKEERESGKKGAILGNGKNVGRTKQNAPRGHSERRDEAPYDGPESIPF